VAGLYLHIPFCASKCDYCDFASVAGGEALIPEYLAALASEAKRYAGAAVDTLFIGGGTPAFLRPGEMTRLLEAVFSQILLAPGAEFTIEANPNLLTKEKAREYAALGCNRISLGLQAAQERLLAAVNRRHTAAQFLRAAEAARAAGISNLSADLISGLPGQTREDMAASARLVSDFSHVSVYSLILEEGTPLARRVRAGEVSLMSDDEEREVFYTANEILTRAGFYRYEISNFARPGFECEHNLSYWRSGEYIGLGAAAVSHLRGARFENPREIPEYLEMVRSGGAGAREEDGDLLKEQIMLRLRLREGICEAVLAKRGLGGLLDTLVAHGLAARESGRFFLTDAGMDVQSAIVIKLWEAA